MRDIKNGSINNHNCIYHSAQRYISRMKNLDLGHNQKCVCIFIHTTMTIHNRVKDKSYIFFSIFRPQILDMQMQSFILSSAFLWASKPGEAIGTYWKMWREAELGGCAGHAQNCRAAARGWCGDARGSSRPPPPPPHLISDRNTEARDFSRNQNPARDEPSASENLQLIINPVEILLMYFSGLNSRIHFYYFQRQVWTGVLHK